MALINVWKSVEENLILVEKLSSECKMQNDDGVAVSSIRFHNSPHFCSSRVFCLVSADDSLKASSLAVREAFPVWQDALCRAIFAFISAPNLSALTVEAAHEDVCSAHKDQRRRQRDGDA